MAFWGIEIKPGTPYCYYYHEETRRLHISQASMFPAPCSSSNERSVVRCAVGNKIPIILCSLLPNKFENCPLIHEFKEEDEVMFSVIGPCPVHLSGFFIGDDEGEDEEEQENPSDDMDSNSSDSSLLSSKAPKAPNSGCTF